MESHVRLLIEDLALSTRDTDETLELYAAHADTLSSTKRLDLAYRISRLALGKDKVSRPTVEQEIVSENWSQACIATPNFLIEPESATDVSKALKIIKFLAIPFSVRSGGHSPNPGFSSIDHDGVLLSMGRMGAITLSADKTIASLGPGARWGDVIDTLDALEASVVGGRIPIVGVAGLILGGGLHHTLSEYGTAADNVHNFEVVLANGDIVNANAGENTDLFWALKGGGPNFGIVTRFDVNTIAVREIWYEISVHSIDARSDIFDAYVEWQREGSADVKSTASLITSPDTITVLLTYSAPVERPAAFAPIYDLEPLAYAVPGTLGTFASLTAILAGIAVMEPMRHDYRAVSSRSDAQLFNDVYDFWRPKALAAREATGANQTFTIQPVSRNAAKRGAANGGNPMNIPEEDHIWWTCLIDWTDAKDDEAVRSVSIETTEHWKTLGQERGLHLPFLFMNDASRDQDPLASYGQDNLAKLRRIARKYDPAQVFQKQQNGGFLLSKAGEA